MHTTYEFLVPLFVKHLSALKVLLEKGKAHATSTGISETELLNARLAPDMFPFVKQVQIACDTAKGAVARLSGAEAPKHEDTEVSFDELSARIDKALQFVQSVPAEKFADSDSRRVELSFFPGMHMTGFGYAQEYVLPNFFFHLTVAYGLLRAAGLSIGKADFMGGLPLQQN